MLKLKSAKGIFLIGILALIVASCEDPLTEIGSRSKGGSLPGENDSEKSAENSESTFIKEE